MANMTFKASLLPNTDLGYSLGSSTQRWNIYGLIAPAGTTAQFYRGDNTWSNTLTDNLNITKAGECGVEVNNTQSTNPNQVAFIVGSSGNAGIYSRKNNKWIVYNTSADRTYLADSYNGTATALAYSQAGLAASAITWLTCWNGYELRAISKAEVANAVDSAHKWVRLAGDTMIGNLTIDRPGSQGEAQCVIKGGAGKIYLYSQASNTANRGIYGYNAAGTAQNIISINQNNVVHLYGTADAASKLATARNIAIAGAVTGNANFDGSANITITTSVNHNHDTLYHAIHTNSWDFSTKQPLSKWVTFDSSAPAGGPDGSWYNGFVSSHNNYLASFIINKHRTTEWYVGWEQYNTSSNTMASAPTWYQLLHTGNYASWTVTKTGGGASGTWGISITGNAMGVGFTGYLSADGSTHTVVSYIKALVDGGKQSGWFTMDGKAGRGCPSDSGNWQFHYWAPSSQGNGVNILCFQYGAAAIYHGYFWRTAANSSAPTWKLLWKQGDAVTGAVWNDYAEFRQADTIEPGYILIEKGDDTLIKSTKRLQDFAGVSSDTWGFAQGETENAKTPIAVAGRVLVYTDKDRKYFKTGDYVCTGKDGKVSKMHWWEKILFPHKVVGVISSVPEYEEWGGGDRPPVKVDGRVWIKVCQ